MKIYISDPAASADLAVIMMQEGLAHLLLIGKRYVKLKLPNSALIPK